MPFVHNFRITAAELIKRPWLCNLTPYQDWPDEAVLAPEVAQNLKERLHLAMSASNVLRLVRHQPFESTGGCFNLLMSQHLRKSHLCQAQSQEGKFKFTMLTSRDPKSSPLIQNHLGCVRKHQCQVLDSGCLQRNPFARKQFKHLGIPSKSLWHFQHSLKIQLDVQNKLGNINYCGKYFSSILGPTHFFPKTNL